MLGFSDFQIARSVLKDDQEYMQEGLLEVRELQEKTWVLFPVSNKLIPWQQNIRP